MDTPPKELATLKQWIVKGAADLWHSAGMGLAKPLHLYETDSEWIWMFGDHYAMPPFNSQPNWCLSASRQITDIDDEVLLLIIYGHRCLPILDDVETILRGWLAGYYLKSEGIEGCWDG